MRIGPIQTPGGQSLPQIPQQVKNDPATVVSWFVVRASRLHRRGETPDHNFGEKFRVSARYLYDRLDRPGSFINNNILSVSDDAYWKSQNITLNGTYLPRPNLVGNLTLTYNRVVNIQLGPKKVPGWVGLGVNVADEVAGADVSGGSGFYLAVDGYFSAEWDPLYRVPRSEYDISNKYWQHAVNWRSLRRAI